MESIQGVSSLRSPFQQRKGVRMESPFKKTTVSALQSIENIHGRSPAPKKSALKVSVPADDTGDFNSIVPLEKEAPNGILITPTKRKRRSSLPSRRISFSHNLTDVRHFKKGNAVTPKQTRRTASPIKPLSGSEPTYSPLNTTASLQDLMGEDLPEERQANISSWGKVLADNFLEESIFEDGNNSPGASLCFQPHRENADDEQPPFKKRASMENKYSRKSLQATLSSHSPKVSGTEYDDNNCDDDRTDDIFRLISSTKGGVEDQSEDDEVSFNIPVSSNTANLNCDISMDLTNVINEQNGSYEEMDDEVEDDRTDTVMAHLKGMSQSDENNTTEYLLYRGNREGKDEDHDDNHSAELQDQEPTATNDISDTAAVFGDRTCPVEKEMDLTECHGGILHSDASSEIDSDKTDYVHAHLLQSLSRSPAKAAPETVVAEDFEEVEEDEDNGQTMDFTVPVRNSNVYQPYTPEEDDQTDEVFSKFSRRDTLQLCAGIDTPVKDRTAYMRAEPEASPATTPEVPGASSFYESAAKYNFEDADFDPFAKRPKLANSPKEEMAFDPFKPRSQLARSPVAYAQVAPAETRNGLRSPQVRSQEGATPVKQQKIRMVQEEEGECVEAPGEEHSRNLVDMIEMSMMEEDEVEEVEEEEDGETEESFVGGETMDMTGMFDDVRVSEETQDEGEPELAQMLSTMRIQSGKAVVSSSAPGVQQEDQEATCTAAATELFGDSSVRQSSGSGNSRSLEVDFDDFQEDIQMVGAMQTSEIARSALSAAPPVKKERSSGPSMNTMYQSVVSSSMGVTPSSRSSITPSRKSLLSEGASPLQEFLANCGIVSSASAKTTDFTTPSRSTAHKRLSMKKGRATPRLTPSAISRLTATRSENWAALMLADSTQRDVPVKLVAAYAENPLLENLNTFFERINKSLVDVGYENERLKQMLSSNTPPIFEILKSASSARRSILSQELQRVFLRCKRQAKLEWLEQLVGQRTQLQDQLASHRQTLSMDITRVNDAINSVNTFNGELDEAVRKSGVHVSLANELKSDRERLSALESKVAVEQEMYEVLKDLHAWGLKEVNGTSVTISYPKTCNIVIQLGDALPTGGRSILSSQVVFPEKMEDSITGKFAPFIATLLQNSDITHMCSTLASTRDIPGLLRQVSVRVQRVVSMTKEIFRLQGQHHQPFLVELQASSKTAGSLTTPVIAKVTFLKRSTGMRYFEIHFGLTCYYPFDTFTYRFVGSSSASETLRSHVEEIVATASAGQSGTGFRPISSVCEALIQFLG